MIKMNFIKPLGRWKWISGVIFTFCVGCVPAASEPIQIQTLEVIPSPTSLITATPTDEVVMVSTQTSTPTQEIIPSPTSQITATSTDEVLALLVHDPDVQTGLDEVDQVINTVLEGDINEIRERIKFTTAGCTHVDGLGGPPKCNEDESEGTMVEVLPILGSEGHFIRRSEIHEWQGIDVTGLYAVYLVSENAFTDKDYPAGAYGIIFRTKMPNFIVIYQVENGSIVRIDSRVGSPPDINFEREAEEFILPPPS
jgi:hypothetical protein